MSPSVYVVACVVVATAVTVFTRAMPDVVSYLGKALPPAIMVILVCYCLRHVEVLQPPHGLPELISCAVVALVHLLRKNMYLSIISGTVCYMILLRIM